MSKYIIALDQGTTSSRAALFNEKGQLVDVIKQELKQIFPQAGWVEHDPDEILETELRALAAIISKHGIKAKDIVGIGIANQRETTVVWDKKTGKAVYNAIVWQDKRTVSMCEDLKRAGLEQHVRETTGLVIDSYFSATKIKWILDTVAGTRKKAMKGDLFFGTVDSWLLWNLTNGKVHATDYSNASRTMLYDITKLKWDERLLEALTIPVSILPEVKPSAHHFGDYELDGVKIPIAGIAGDQQAALFGQGCFRPGMAKSTYGTGCFLLMNTGEKSRYSKHGLITTIAWGIENKVLYALEGSVFIAGASVQWMRDAMKFFTSAADSETLAREAVGDSSVYVVPAFAGLGAPYWDMRARGAIFGLTRDTRRSHIVRATLESVAYQTKDVLDAMQEDSGLRLTRLQVDGGACANDFLMQFQADILNLEVERPENIESTALGAAYFAGIAVGLWKKEDILRNRKIEKTFLPTFDTVKREKLCNGWKKSVQCVMQRGSE